MKNNLLSQLEELNLSSNEAAVYLALLEIGQTSAGELIRKTNFHRSVVYETLDKLIDKNLVFKLIKNNVWHFQASEPEKLLNRIKAQEEIAHGLIPNLKDLTKQKLPEITVYEGIKSYQRFWLESVQRMPKGSTDYVAGSIGGPWVDYLGPISKQYFRIAKKRNIGWKMIVFDIDDYEQTFLKKYPDFRWECRLIDKNVSKEGNFNIFGTESVVLHSATDPMIIEVKNQSLVRVFQNLFNILWDSGKNIKK
jgi:predicted transcriptional regulator